MLLTNLQINISSILKSNYHLLFLPTLSTLFATKLMGPRINAYFVTPSHGLFLTCRGEKYEQYIFTTYEMSNYHMCGNCTVKNKKPLLGVVAFCVKDANFPPHQSHAVNCLPFTHKPFWPPTPPLSIPFNPISTHVTHLTGKRRHWHAGPSHVLNKYFLF